jgi:hypothetical protein
MDMGYSDHRAVVAMFRARRNQPLTKYPQRRQRLPLRLPPEPQNKLTRDFEALQSTCRKTEPKDRQGNDWISDKTWRMISHSTMLRRTGKLCQTAARTMQRQIWTALRGDRTTRIAHVGECIEHEFAGGNVQEAFCHLKGWYRAALETTTRPCPQTMEWQTAERIALYARRDSPGEPIPINIDLIPVDNETPTDSEMRAAAHELTNG